MLFSNIRVFNFEGALRGMRNPKNSWHLSDSFFGIADWDDAYRYVQECAYSWAHSTTPEGEDVSIDAIDKYTTWLDENHRLYVDEDYVDFACIGPKDMKLAKALIAGGSEHRKFLRQILVSVDITAPRYWWAEFDTYKVGTTANSTSTMHKLTSKPIDLNCFEIDDLSTDLVWDKAYYTGNPMGQDVESFNDYISHTLRALEGLRQKYLETKDKRYWKELVRWLPNGWLQTRTVTMNYENLLSMCHQREHHKLTEWSGVDPFGTPSFIKFAKSLPYANDFIFPST